jgi:HK97 family phage major capsid protein
MSEYVTREEFQQLRGALEGARDAMQAVQSFAAANRTPSKALLIGNGTGGRSVTSADTFGFFKAVADARSSDATAQASGKAALEFMGSSWSEPDPSKATLGTSGSAGSYIMPNAVVDKLVEIQTATNPYRSILTVRAGVASPSVAIPVEASAPTRSVVAAWGTLKSNVDITFAQYTATFYTLAKIHDVANQLLRYSQGAAEQDILDRGARSMALGEAYYITQGGGTTEPTGLLTALASIGGFDTTKSAATTTIATSIAGTIVSGIKALGLRAVKADAIVLDIASYYTALTEAVATFSVMGALGGNVASAIPTTGADGQLRLFNLPLIADLNLPANTGIVGEFKAASLYTGLGARVDVSDQAGTRWDYNETGYRFEEEIAFNALPYVAAGRFQRLLSLNT